MDTFPARKKSITWKYDIISNLAAVGILSLNQKKLRRLPHVFCKVLELPFKSEVPVAVEENRECFRFIVNSDEALAFQEVWTEIIEISPGVIKVVIREANRKPRISMDEQELDMWRFRMPSSTMPELSTVVYSDGKFVVKVPKEGDFSERNEVSGIKSSKMDGY